MLAKIALKEPSVQMRKQCWSHLSHMSLFSWHT
uniref:Uncharacterized protein n=1 Tax=Arundo donax TaxID=35708 RepID=A0A0A8Z906_ARUDO